MILQGVSAKIVKVCRIIRGITQNRLGVVLRKVPRSSAATHGLAKEKGMVLAMVLYIIIIFVVIGLVSVTIMAVLSQSSFKLFFSTQAYYLTESGLEYGLYELGNTFANDSYWNDGSPAANLATGIAFNPPSQSNCTFSLGFATFNSTTPQNGILTSVGTIVATQIFSPDSIIAQRVISMNVPVVY